MKNEEIRIAVLVSGGGTNLQALIDAQQSGLIHSGKIVLVLASNQEAYALTRAAKAGIPTAVVPRKDCGSQEEFEQGILHALDDAHAELLVLAGFLCILSAGFTRRYPNRILNVHPSLIPAFCGKGFYGLRVHEAALARGVKLTGATVHFVNEIPDGGEIIMQKAVATAPGDTPEVLQQRVMREAEWVILPRAVEQVSAALLNAQERNGQ